MNNKCSCTFCDCGFQGVQVFTDPGGNIHVSWCERCRLTCPRGGR